MNDHDALFTSIIAEPDEDTHRLVYADFLEERDQGSDSERATFIRTQIQIATLSEALDACWCDDGGRYEECATCVDNRNKLKELEKDQAYLLDKLKDDLVRSYPGRIAIAGSYAINCISLGKGDTAVGPPRQLYFVRGFLQKIVCSTEDFLKDADQILWHPSEYRPCPITAVPLREVTLTTDIDWYAPGEYKLVLSTHPEHLMDIPYDCKYVKYGDWCNQESTRLVTKFNKHGHTVLDYILAHEWPQIKKWDLTRTSPM